MCRVLIADDSPIMRTAIRKVLEEESFVDIVDEASNFVDAMQKIVDLKPDVLLLDLHMPEERKVSPELVRSQLGGVRTVAISFSNDQESKTLAESYGATILLDKMSLYTDLIPAVQRCDQDVFRKPSKPKKP